MLLLRCGLLLVCCLSFATTLLGAEFYVTPSGRSDGDGSQLFPWDLQTALAHPPTVRPGDTIFLRQGTYQRTDFFPHTSTLSGAATAPIFVRGYRGERATISPGLRVDQGEFVWFMDLELFNPDTSQYGPYNHARVRTLDVNGGNHLKFINLVIHRGGQGIGFWEGCTDCEVYGCLIYHNGWTGSNQGHGIYVHNDEGYKHIRNNIIFNQLGTGYNLHGYGSSGDQLRNIVVEENVIFNGWSLIGGGSNTPVTGIEFNGNDLYRETLQLGHLGETVTEDLIMLSNTVEGRLLLKHWQQFEIGQNRWIVHNQLWDWMMLVTPLFKASPLYHCNYNTYYSGADPTLFNHYGGTTYDLAQWQQTTGLDLDSRFQLGSSPDQLIVRQNQYDPLRYHVIVYNWSQAGEVSLPVPASQRSAGKRWRLRNAQDYYNQGGGERNIVTGLSAGSGVITISLNPDHYTVAVPRGLTTPVADLTLPRFGVFVLDWEPKPSAQEPEANLHHIKASPNPWRSREHGVVACAFAARPGTTEIRVYALDGRRVRTLWTTGADKATWDLRDNAGELVPAGVYGFLAWQNGRTYARGKVTVLK